MEELEIIDKNKNVYKLKDKDEKEYKLTLLFQDIEEKPQIGDKIYINEKLIDPKYEGYSTIYSFGNLKNKYGKKDISIIDIDVIKMTIGEKKILMKRLYG